MQDPEEGAARQPAETLQGGSARPPLSEKIPVEWRQHGAVVLALVAGVAAGGGAVLWSQDQPAPPATRADEHAVELVLFETIPLREPPRGFESDIGPLQVDGALLLSGLATSTVTGIGAPGRSLDVRAPALPVTVAPTERFQPVSLVIRVRDCRAATRWTAGDRPFTIRWRDEDGRSHTDRAGDFGTPLADSLVRYIDGICANPPTR